MVHVLWVSMETTTWCWVGKCKINFNFCWWCCMLESSLFATSSTQLRTDLIFRTHSLWIWRVPSPLGLSTVEDMSGVQYLFHLLQNKDLLLLGWTCPLNLWVVGVLHYFIQRVLGKNSLAVPIPLQALSTYNTWHY